LSVEREIDFGAGQGIPVEHVASIADHKSQGAQAGSIIGFNNFREYTFKTHSPLVTPPQLV
jgi:hypothetical protein